MVSYTSLGVAFTIVLIPPVAFLWDRLFRALSPGGNYDGGIYLVACLLTAVGLGYFLAFGLEDGWIAYGLALLWERLRRPAGPEALPAALGNAASRLPGAVGRQEEIRPGAVSAAEGRAAGDRREQWFASRWDAEAPFCDRVCPLRQGGFNGRDYFGPCYKEKCGFWDSGAGRCGVAVVFVGRQG